jgi:hypothetical protein
MTYVIVKKDEALRPDDAQPPFHMFQVGFLGLGCHWKSLPLRQAFALTAIRRIRVRSGQPQARATNPWPA